MWPGSDIYLLDAEKRGTKNADGTITWTIVVNEAKEELNGWTLKDVFNETDLRLEADIAPPVDGKDTIELPYRFEQEDHTTYTITCTTKEEVLLGWQQAVNKAVLEKGDESIEQEMGVYIPECEQYDPLIKEGIGILASGNDPMQARWNVLIDLSYSSLQPGWTYEDTLSGEDPYFSPEQKEQLEKAVTDAFGLKESEINKNENGFTSGVIDLVWKKESWESKTKGFVITGHTVIEQGKNIAFSYKSGSGADSGTLYNKGVLKDRGHSVEERAEQTLLPLLEKWDPSLPGSTFTIHDRKDLTDDTLSWHVLIHIPKSQSEALTITDWLPKSVKCDILPPPEEVGASFRLKSEQSVLVR